MKSTWVELRPLSSPLTNKVRAGFLLSRFKLNTFDYRHTLADVTRALKSMADLISDDFDMSIKSQNVLISKITCPL